MSKVTSGLLSGKYSPPAPSEGETPLPGDVDGDGDSKTGEPDCAIHNNVEMVAPRMLKHLVGHGHSEFSSGRQQDAAEYMQHLLEVSALAHQPMYAYVSPHGVQGHPASSTFWYGVY